MTSDPRVKAALKAYGLSGLDIRSHTHAMTEALAAADRAALEGAPALATWCDECATYRERYPLSDDDGSAKRFREAAATLTAQAAEIETLTRLLEQYRMENKP